MFYSCCFFWRRRKSMVIKTPPNIPRYLKSLVSLALFLPACTGKLCLLVVFICAMMLPLRTFAASDHARQDQLSVPIPSALPVPVAPNIGMSLPVQNLSKTATVSKDSRASSPLVPSHLPPATIASPSVSPSPARAAAPSHLSTLQSAPVPFASMSARQQAPSPVKPVPSKGNDGQRAVKKEKTAASKATARKKKNSKKSGLEAFAANPLRLSGNSVKDEKYGVLRSNATAAKLLQKSQKNVPATGDGKVTISGKSTTPPSDRLETKRAPFSGGGHTLPYMDVEQNAEVSMEYRINRKTRTRLVVNPQDPSSPLYTPADQEKRINSGGVYMNVDVGENVQLKMGGEYCEVDDSDNSGSSRSSQGAAVGLQWNF